VEADGAEEGGLNSEDRLANNALHRSLRMKTPKHTCTFLPGCNNPVNRSRCPEDQACQCCSPTDPDTSVKVDCSSLINEATNQAMHDKAQKLFKASVEAVEAGRC
jgi:hypothetical protein